MKNNISKELLSCLTPRTPYTLHSRFPAGFNLQVGSLLAFVGNKNEEALPFSLLTETAPPQLPPDTVFYWDAQNATLFSDAFSVSVGDTASYSSAVLPLACFWEESLPHFDASVDLTQPTGLTRTIADLSDPAHCPETAALCRCFSCGDEALIQETLKSWIGRGPGLTPSGDDFLLGLLFVDRMMPFLGGAFHRALRTLVSAEYTTAVSTNYYACAFRAWYCASLRGVREALAQRSPCLLRKALAGVNAFGHTSGKDMLAGLRLGLLYRTARAD